ncbi:molybdopterin biosynthesis protein MoeE [Microlunatus endophyticus]|uniref:Molybdopterin biosynthesis protein MoeE n=1 Tax=Microlunatus endophyticus TaxID=1716077 RepID=A0A917S3T1_9ACTN|nr:molybdenum cofactor biosynthesis protein MoaE [Microlunatus endophyticus]GGL56462.1 molybdopterin biosynthesis protein MoeE [Microlunatus endophyticus]
MQQKVRAARLLDEPLSVDRVVAAVTDPAVGGIVTFIGAVRDHDRPTLQDSGTLQDPDPGERGVVALDYTAHPSAADRLVEVAERAAAVEGVHAVAVEHRIGHLEVGDLAVVIAVGAAHRAEAFASCRQLIDELKSGVPIWKEQTFLDGVSEWVGLP